jgi:hypothetical protein
VVDDGVANLKNVRVCRALESAVRKEKEIAVPWWDSYGNSLKSLEGRSAMPLAIALPPICPLALPLSVARDASETAKASFFRLEAWLADLRGPSALI